MIPQSILDMINEATKKAYVLTTLEYIRDECKSHADFCKGCPFFVGEPKQKKCFFNFTYTGTEPDQWDLDELKEIIEKENANDKG